MPEVWTRRNPEEKPTDILIDMARLEHARQVGYQAGLDMLESPARREVTWRLAIRSRAERNRVLWILMGGVQRVAFGWLLARVDMSARDTNGHQTATLRWVRDNGKRCYGQARFQIYDKIAWVDRVRLGWLRVRQM